MGHGTDSGLTAAALVDRPVQVVAGKGGVGRSVVASALALRSARAGHRTLLLEVNAPDSCARLLDVPPAPDTPREVLNHLWLCRMTPAGALREYALMVLKFKALYNFVFENPLVKHFLRSIPSLGEFTMMGKAWFHSTEELPNGRPRYDRIIIDAPATGHALTLLSVSRVVAETVPRSIMKDAAQKMASLLEDTSRACLHVVATPEEMPVNEAVEIIDACKERLRMSTGVAFANRVLPAAFTPEDAPVVEQLASAELEVVSSFAEAARRRVAKERMQREHVARLRDRAQMPVVQIPDQGPIDDHGEWMSALVDAIEAELGPSEVSRD